MQLTLGETLYRLRIERNIESKQVCDGLCDEATLSRARDEARAMDGLLFEFIAGRMGATSEEFSLMVTENEYNYRQWQEKVYVAIEAEKWDDLKQLLEADIKGIAWINEKLQKQFYHYAKGIYLGAIERYTEAYEELCLAKDKTILSKYLQEKNTYLNTLELHILMLRLFYGVKSKSIDAPRAIDMFRYLETYIYDGILDIREKAKIYPKLVCIGLYCLSAFITETEKRKLCENAISILRKDKTFHDITELLHLYILLLESIDSEEISFYKKQYEVFCDLLQSEGISIEFRPDVLTVRKPKVYMIHEYLSSKRKEKGLTQEVLSEGICEPETYSRVEGGKRAPSRKNFKALAERLDISWALYRGEIVSDDFKAYELRRKQRCASIEGRWKDSLELTRELEQCLDMTMIENYQYVKCREYVLRSRIGDVDIDEVCVKLEDLLAMTQSMNRDVSKLVYYSQIDMEIIAYLAQAYGEKGRHMDGIQLIETVVKQMQNSRLEYEDQWNGFSILFRSLAWLYFAVGKYDMSIQISKYVKKNIICRREGVNLPQVLDEIADGLENISIEYSEEYKKLYRYTYYVADLFAIDNVKSFTRRYYEDNFDEKIKWY